MIYRNSSKIDTSNNRWSVETVVKSIPLTYIHHRSLFRRKKYISRFTIQYIKSCFWLFEQKDIRSIKLASLNHSSWKIDYARFEWVSEWSLFNINWAILRYVVSRTKYCLWVHDYSQKSWVILLMNIHKPNRVMYDVSK